MESRELFILCMYFVSVICVVKGIETYNDNRGIVEVSKFLECFFVCIENFIFLICWGEGFLCLILRGKIIVL